MAERTGVTAATVVERAYETLNHPGYGPTHAFTIPLLGSLAVVEALTTMTAELRALTAEVARVRAAVEFR